MPRPMLKQVSVQPESNSILSAPRDTRQKEKLKATEQMKLDRLLRKPRSKKFMELVHQLDAGGHVHNEKQVNDLIESIANEFPELSISGILLGIVSVCHLGKPYEVHSLDMTGQIIEHYKTGQTLPGMLEKARPLAIRGGYDFIEVYVDCCRAVSPNGSISVVPF